MDHRPHQAPDLDHAHVLIGVVLGGRVKPAQLGLFLDKGFHYPDAGKGLLNPVGQGRKGLLHSPEEGVDPLAKVRSESGQKRQGQQGQKGQTPIDLGGHGVDSDHRQENRVHEHEDPRPHGHADGVYVVSGVGHQVSRFVVIKKVDRQGLQVGEQAVAQVILQAPGRAHDVNPPKIAAQGHEGGDSQNKPSIAEESGGVYLPGLNEVSHLAQEAGYLQVYVVYAGQPKYSEDIAPNIGHKKSF